MSDGVVKSDDGATRVRRSVAGLTFRCAQTIDDVLAAWHLAYVAYRRRDVIPPNRHQLYFPQNAVGPQSVVLVGQIGPVIVSTLTVTLESPFGLPADHTFGREWRGERRPGQRFVEMHLFADRRADDDRTEGTFLQLLALGWSCGTMLEATDCVMATHPSRIPFFRYAVGFEPLSEPRLFNGLHACPQVMLHRGLSPTAAAPTGHAGLRPLLDQCQLPPAFGDRYRFESNEVARSAIIER